MPTKISAAEVLEYLNELGYVNINAQQLKEFMQGKVLKSSPIIKSVVFSTFRPEEVD